MEAGVMAHNMNQEQYIEHEVKLRVHEKQFEMLHMKLNFLISGFIGAIIIPVILHHYGLV